MVINGIQQIGIGVVPAREVYNWYKNTLGFDILIFEDDATAPLMSAYSFTVDSAQGFDRALHRGVSVMWKTRMAPL